MSYLKLLARKDACGDLILMTCLKGLGAAKRAKAWQS